MKYSKKKEKTVDSVNHQALRKLNKVAKVVKGLLLQKAVRNCKKYKEEGDEVSFQSVLQLIATYKVSIYVFCNIYLIN